ncbi:MAG: UDP-N-acetylmuramate--L-alanine ligase [Firmicutes bacterium]|nr:UDP-N-acetylmuramate--L-alanine ligase [Bacillota bacterium]
MTCCSVSRGQAFCSATCHIHMIGIGGASMSGLARMLKEMGHTVTGSDRVDSDAVKKLRELGIDISIGHVSENVHSADLVVYTAAIPEDNAELVECRRLGIPTMERSVALGQISEGYEVSLGVCCTHGKTTKTSMLAQMLIEADMDPTVHIGGVLDAIGGSVRTGGSNIFLTEACEYKRNILNIHTKSAVLLNIDNDHLDCYEDIEDIADAFGKYLRSLPSDGWALVNGDDERAVQLLTGLSCKTFTFGRINECDYQMTNISEDEAGYVSCHVYYKDEKLGEMKMIVPGMFNAMNALAAIGAAHQLGADMEKVFATAGKFTGARRRFEKTGELNGAEIFHDYGHNPTEIKNALYVARKRCREGRLWAVVQPHTYSRLKASFDDYVTCVGKADVVLVTDIFAAREKDPGDIESGMLVDAMQKMGVNAYLTPAVHDAAKMISGGVASGDLVITLGCGDINGLNNILAGHAE